MMVIWSHGKKKEKKHTKIKILLSVRSKVNSNATTLVRARCIIFTDFILVILWFLILLLNLQ